MKKVALFLFLSVCFAQQSCSSDSVGTEPEENPQDILFKDDFNFFDEKVWTKETFPNERAGADYLPPG